MDNAFAEKNAEGLAASLERNIPRAARNASRLETPLDTCLLHLGSRSRRPGCGPARYVDELHPCYAGSGRHHRCISAPERVDCLIDQCRVPVPATGRAGSPNPIVAGQSVLRVSDQPLDTLPRESARLMSDWVPQVEGAASLDDDRVVEELVAPLQLREAGGPLAELHRHEADTYLIHQSEIECLLVDRRACDSDVLIAGDLSGPGDRSHRPRPIGEAQQDQSHWGFLYRNYSHPDSNLRPQA